jgi:hypothetical protein
MATKPVIYPGNVLEAAILTMEPDGPVDGKGVDKLVDRDVGLECEDNGIAGTRIWHADLGDTPPPPVATWIFVGSGYAGKTVALESSTDDLVWVPRGSVVPTSDAVQRVELAGAPHAFRYWRWTITGPDVPIRFREVFLTVGVQLQFNPAGSSMREGILPQVGTLQSATGRAWGIKRGQRRWTHSYVMQYSPDADRLKIHQVSDALDDGARPCWLLSLTGELRWVRIPMNIDLQLADRSLGNWDIPIEPVEELP